MIEWSRALLQRGVEVTPVILRSTPALRAAVEGEGLPFVFLERSSFDPRTLSDFLSLIERRRIQVLHLQGHGSSMFGRLAARIARRPAIVHVHADYRCSAKGYPWYVRLADRALARGTALPLSVSDHLVPFMAEEQGFRRDRIVQRREARADIGIEAASPVAIALGRLDHMKGIDVLLEAWRTVADRWPSSVLLIAGDGPEHATLERLAAAHELRGVRFLGQRSDVRALLWASDLMVMPSREEAMPMAALEALGCGVPVVASRVGGIPEIIRDGENGVLVPVEDPGELGRAIDGLFSDESCRESLARGAARLITPYGLDQFVADLEVKYRALVAGTSRAGAARCQSSN
jgi:glycosyltransferase involved in cell wall biosynthesis